MNYKGVDCKFQFILYYFQKRHNVTLHFTREQKIYKVENQEIISSEIRNKSCRNNGNQSNLNVSAPVFQLFQGNHKTIYCHDV